MIIGVPKEIKENEFRVSATPDCVIGLVSEGHKVIVQSGAGDGSGYTDKDYINAGAELVNTIKDVYSKSNLIVKVKEPLEDEYHLINKDHMIFTYFHLSSNKRLTSVLLDSGSICIAYETIEFKFSI